MPHQAVTFYYKFGDNNIWQSIKKGSNDLSFAHISSGTYQLSLCSTNPAIDKHAKISTYYIIVPSPWYACTVAILIYVLIAIGIVVFTIIWYIEGTKRSVYLRESPKMMEEPRIEIVR